ncbi:MAG: DUF2096 family protein [Methanobacteriaceae archaeon]|nr:DUF2096 family protein [Methanobacteriaceae archaeon]
MENKQVTVFEQRWLVLDHLLKELIQENEIPKETFKNLQMAKSTINFFKEDPSDPIRAQEIGRIDTFLNNAQDILMNLTEKKSEEFIIEWNRNILDACMGKEVFKPANTKSVFIPGLPSNFDYVKFNFREPMYEERFYEVCEYNNVIIEFDDDESIFIYGQKENIQESLKEITSFFQEQL